MPSTDASCSPPGTGRPASAGPYQPTQQPSLVHRRRLYDAERIREMAAVLAARPGSDSAQARGPQKALWVRHVALGNSARARCQPPRLH